MNIKVADHQGESMRTPSARLILASLVAALVLASAVSTVSASRLSTSEQNIRITWRILEFTLEVSTIRCPVTLEGSFHASTFTKVARTLIGLITRAIAAQRACTSGIIAPANGSEPYNGGTIAQSLPWHLTYESFTGILPFISSVRIALQRFLFGMREAANFCTGRYGLPEDRILFRAELERGGAITLLSPIIENNTMNILRTDLGGCPGFIRFTTAGDVTALASTSRVTLTLI